MRRIDTSEKKYPIYDQYTTYFIPLMYIFLTTAVLGLCVFFVIRFLVMEFDPGVFPLLLVFIGPYSYTIFESIRTGYIQRLFLRIRVDAIGLHCSGLGWKAYTITWDSVRTYAVFSQSDPQYLRTLIMFSTIKEERPPSNYVEANFVSMNRVIFLYRSDVWEVLDKHMPQDIKKKLNYALNDKRSCFHRR